MWRTKRKFPFQVLIGIILSELIVSTLMGDIASKVSRGAAAQFFVAGELNRRGIVAVVT